MLYNRYYGIVVDCDSLFSLCLVDMFVICKTSLLVISSLVAIMLIYVEGDVLYMTKHSREGETFTDFYSTENVLQQIVY